MRNVRHVRQADWHPEDIKAAVRKRGSTLSELASANGVPKQLHSACMQSRTSERGDDIIAEFLGVKPQDIWPSRYAENGKRIRYRALNQREREAA